MPIEKIDTEKCSGCGVCLALCQEDVIRLDKASGKAVAKYNEDCIACFVCESYCPLHCISVSKDRARPIPSIY